MKNKNNWKKYYICSNNSIKIRSCLTIEVLKYLEIKRIAKNYYYRIPHMWKLFHRKYVESKKLSTKRKIKCITLQMAKDHVINQKLWGFSVKKIFKWKQHIFIRFSLIYFIWRFKTWRALDSKYQWYWKIFADYFYFIFWVFNKY